MSLSVGLHKPVDDLFKVGQVFFPRQPRGCDSMNTLQCLVLLTERATAANISLYMESHEHEKEKFPFTAVFY